MDLSLPICKLKNPLPISLALNGKETSTALDNCVTLTISSHNNAWSSHAITAIITPHLCTNILLGLPFLAHNKIIINHYACTAIHKPLGFNLLNETSVPPKNCVPKLSPKIVCAKVAHHQTEFLKELKWKCSKHCKLLEELSLFKHIKPLNVITAIRTAIEQLSDKEKFLSLETELKSEFSDIFEPIPHVNKLPMNETA